jgi:Domain of unknown function (DUF397)
MTSLYEWRKSSRSGSSTNCVEVAANVPGVVVVRDSKDPGGPKLTFAPAGWDAFTVAVRNGEFDLG